MYRKIHTKTKRTHALDELLIDGITGDGGGVLLFWQQRSPAERNAVKFYTSLLLSGEVKFVIFLTT